MTDKPTTVTHDEDLADTLIAISVISKRLATKIKEDDNHESNEKNCQSAFRVRTEQPQHSGNQAIRFEIQDLLSPKETKVEDKQPAPTFTKEDVRKVLATKAKDGFKNEVKALLKAYGAESLSTLDEKHYGAVMEEAGGIGHGQPRSTLCIFCQQVDSLSTQCATNRRHP